MLAPSAENNQEIRSPMTPKPLRVSYPLWIYKADKMLATRQLAGKTVETDFLKLGRPWTKYLRADQSALPRMDVPPTWEPAGLVIMKLFRELNLPVVSVRLRQVRQRWHHPELEDVVLVIEETMECFLEESTAAMFRQRFDEEMLVAVLSKP
jgi:hypothetical protein